MRWKKYRFANNPDQETSKNIKGRPKSLPFMVKTGILCVLERLNVRSLPTLRPLNDVELNGLTFLQTLKAIGVNGGVVHEDIFTILARDEPEPFCVVKPLHCSLFHV